jgi:hypothetical protein
MGLSVDDIITKFLTKMIPNIQGEPGYGSISNMVQMMHGNTASLPTSLGGGKHVYEGLVMTPILYATLSNKPYIHPDEPGTTPRRCPNNATKAQRELQSLEQK